MDPRWQEALEATRGVEPTPKAISRLAEEFGAELCRWVFLQWTLRERAAAKFAKAAEMLFDRPGLEMASHEVIARYHASRFPEGVIVADLTTGIGADLIALARRGPAIGFELDPVRAQCVRHNLAAHGLDTEVRVADSLAAEWDFDYAFADPARRTESGRTWNLHEFSPHPVQLGDRMRGLKLAGMKLSPMLRDDFFRHLPGRVEFVSFGGECREALVWMGSEAGEGRFAVQITGSADTPVGAASESPSDLEISVLASGGCGERVEEAGEFLFEADPAAIRADALGTLARETSAKLLGDSNGYLTSDHEVTTPWQTTYRILANHPADLRKTSSVLRSLGGGTPVVKSRVPRFDVETLRHQLRGEGRELIVAVYPVGKKLRHAILERI